MFLDEIVQLLIEINRNERHISRQLDHLIGQLNRFFNPVATQVLFKLGDKDMLSPAVFNIPDSTTGTFTLIATPQNSSGLKEPVTSPGYAPPADSSIITNFLSSDGLTATFTLASPAVDGSAVIGWAATASAGSALIGQATITVIAGVATQVDFTLMLPSSLASPAKRA